MLGTLPIKTSDKRYQVDPTTQILSMMRFFGIVIFGGFIGFS